MFSFCEDPALLSDLPWLACYLTTGGHFAFYLSFLKVLGLLAVTAPVALAFGFCGAMAVRSQILPITALGRGYVAVVRGVPEIAFFMFFVIAIDQALEWLRHKALCLEWDEPIRQNGEFIVCASAKLPLSSASELVHDSYSFAVAIFTFAVVFGAFTANVLLGAMRSVPHAQIETAEAYGMTPRQSFWRILVPQMWSYALPGLSNLWQILIKATPLLFLLGIEDIVYWAGQLGASKTSRFTDYPHGDWRMWYFLGLLVFYLLMTWGSEELFLRLSKKLSHGQATVAGEAQRKEAY